MNAVELEGVNRRFGSVDALHGLSLVVERGEVLGLLGHNGAGKSTTLKLILGVLAPSAGRVRVLGEDPRGRGAYRLRLRLGYLPESVTFYDNLSGREVLRYFARLKRVAPREADALLERVGLGDAAERRVRGYSKGMRQRLGLAQAMLGEPRLLLLDEPTVGLDPLATRDVHDMIDTLRGRGASIVLCSHVLPGLERHIDRAAILSQGRLIAAGSIEGLRAEAGLPLRIHARADAVNGALNEQLAGHVAALETRPDGAIEITAAPERKLEVLRRLLAAPQVTDVSVEAPTLETLYAHFDRLGGDTGEQS